MSAKSVTYKSSGVNIDTANAFIQAIKPMVQKTERSGVLSTIGHYAGLFEIDLQKYREPVIVASTDGVGTKLKLALDGKNLRGLGQDLVAMSANDILCVGAEPLFFLDYFATGHLQVKQGGEIVEGISKACAEIHCALLGGETAEMPNLYRKGDFDLAGFVVGIVEKSEILDGRSIQVGDRIIGLSSSGFHSNGFSLIRKILSKKRLSLRKKYPPLKRPLGEALLEPTRLYVQTVKRLKERFHLKGIAHITGGGLLENLPRILPQGCRAVLREDSWLVERDPLFDLIQEWGRVSRQEMHRVFNCGIGLMLVVPPNEMKALLEDLNHHGETAWAIGKIVARGKNEEAIEIL